MNFNEEALKLHAEHKGKIEVISKVPVKTRDDLSTAYTPGVAEPCRKIHENKNDVYKYTAKGNLVAVVTDGTAVLGLGNIAFFRILLGTSFSFVDLICYAAGCVLFWLGEKIITKSFS